MASMDRSRRGHRVAIEIPARLIDADGGEVPVVVTDVSSGGFRLQIEQPLVPGERVNLSVDRDRIYPAEIEWSSRREAGGRFLEPIELVDGLPR